MNTSGGDQGKAERLKALIERHEHIDDQIADLRVDRRDIRAEMKEADLDLATIDMVLKRRRKDPHEVIEADQLLESYEIALGCGAAAAGVLTASRGADGMFEVKMVVGPAAVEEPKLTQKRKARKAAVLLAELSRRAREA